MMPTSRSWKLQVRDGFSRKIRKSVSCEPILDFSSSDDEERTGGAQLQAGSLTPSPAAQNLFPVIKSASETARSRPSSTDSFQIRANTDDDVFSGRDGYGTNHVRPSFQVHEDIFDDEGKQLALVDAPASIDAQGIYPPTACIFAANLAQVYDDKTLEFEVTRVFSQYGPVFVKIRRDSRQMPFAFCQFTTDIHAQNAEKQGKGTVILGRPCRTEMVRAHGKSTLVSQGSSRQQLTPSLVSFIVYKTSGQPIEVYEAADLLGSLGEIAKAEPLQGDIQQSLEIPPAIIASYKMYDPKRDVVHTFRGNRIFNVIPYDPKTAPTGDSALPRSIPDKNQFLNQYDRDRRSAYMGNLPMNMTEGTLKEMASACGAVVAVNLYKKAVPGSQGKMTCFAFVEYVRPDSADDAIVAFNNKDINGFRIRVDRKQSRTFGTPRKGPPARATARYSHATFPRRRMGHSMEPPSPLRGLFDPPLSSEQDDQCLLTEDLTQMKFDPSPPAKDAPDGANTNKKAFTPTPKRSGEDGMSHRGYMGMETPTTLHHPPPPMPVPWPHAFGPYGPPPMQQMQQMQQIPPFGPMTPHATPGIMYGGYYPSPYYPSMFPDIFQMLSPAHAPPPPNVPNASSAPSQVPSQAAKAPETGNGQGKTSDEVA